MTYNFDMDGTIADLYGVAEWLTALNAENPAPYMRARPLVNMARLAKALHKAQRNGHKVAVVSWLAKGASPAYDEAVAQAKRKWLARHLPSVQWDEIIIVRYGTPKQQVANGVLFDDETPNREQWGEGAFPPDQIFEVLATAR